MKFAFIGALSLMGASVASAAPDPYAYHELVVTESNPVAVRPGLWDFGKDGVGWLSFRGVAPGAYEIVIGELTNAVGHVTNAYPRSTIRCQRLAGTVDAADFRVPMPPDRLNLTGYFKDAPAIRLPERLGIVFPFRYVEIVKTPGPIVAANLVRSMVHYPIDMGKSSFASDCPVLDEIYAMCKYSILATSFCGVYVDGDRERTPYEGDAYINQLGHYAIDDDYSLARKSCEWLADHPTWPTEWRQHQIMMHWADWMWTGDTRSIAKYWRKLAEEKLLSQYARPEDGLLLTGGENKKGSRIPGGGDIVDWPPAERDGFVFRPVNAVINAFYHLNLGQMSQMAAAIGKREESARYTREAARIRASFRRAFLNRRTGLFVDGEGTTHASLHANATALAFGLADEGEKAAIAAFLEKKGMACSVYFAQYLLEALCAAGRDDAVVRLMSATDERSWHEMIRFGSTVSMEAWNVKAKSNLDLNHAWGTVPLNIISRHVLGVTPLEPGFRRISIAPCPGGLGRVKGVVPTAVGPVRVDAAGDALTVETPAPARVTWRGVRHEVAAGRHVFCGAGR